MADIFYKHFFFQPLPQHQRNLQARCLDLPARHPDIRRLLVWQDWVYHWSHLETPNKVQHYRPLHMELAQWLQQPPCLVILPPKSVSQLQQQPRVRRCSVSLLQAPLCQLFLQLTFQPIRQHLSALEVMLLSVCCYIDYESFPCPLICPLPMVICGLLMHFRSHVFFLFLITFFQ